MTDNGPAMLASRAIVSRPGDEKAIETPATGHLTFRARSDQTGGAVTVWVSVIEPGQGPPLHVHLREDEFFYVLEGCLRFRLGDDLFEAHAGSFVFIPRGMPHAWQNVGEGQVRFLGGLTPGSPALERFFERSAELAADTRLAESFGRFASDAGMEVLGPPLAQSHPVPSVRA